MITVLIKRFLLPITGSLCGLIFILSPVRLFAQQSVLDRYIHEAMEKSPLLYQDSLSLHKSEMSEKIAKSYYIPTSDFQFGYQTSAGGRSIDLPVGDMLNGVYSTLNQLTGTTAFPHIQNERINFFPQNFYDAKIRTTVPVYNPEVRPNIDLAQKQIKGSQIGIQLKKRDLVSQVKGAYYNFLMSLSAVEVYRDGLSLANEGKRVNDRLLQNGKGLPAYVLRSEAEIESIKAELFKAEVQVKNAGALFNFLTSRSDGEMIDTSFDESAALAACYQLLTTDLQIENREEIKAFENASQLYQSAIQLNKSSGKPRLNGILDLGSQASRWQFNDQSRYFLLALQLDIPLFTASRVKMKVEQSRLDLRQNESRKEYAGKQLKIAATTAINNLSSALESLKAREKQMDAAAAYKRLTDKGYAEGVTTFIETIDARTQWMQSQIAYKIQVYQTLKAAAAVERELALYPID